MSRRSHPVKEIEAALRYAKSWGWRVVAGGGHAWGRMYCPCHGRDCRCGEFCITCIWSTPKNAHNHARALCRVVDHCAVAGPAGSAQQEE
ncbi:hypothetical protein F9C28_18520 [Shimwellia pseudoproteus]|uniref:hypothetical protein n=1 Tax=Shimwellia pseudoproteus TaxID=570012 RepID=UPI0018EDA7AB|nr:hypothetical protein [Shimwellia pseudoproteus]MBJ3816843.1 hypothetical protein [Shimwellia pseudoproteus]